MSADGAPLPTELASLRSPTLLQHIGYFACSVDFERIDHDVLHQAVRVLADSLTCALASAAADQREIRALREFAAQYASSASGSVGVWGSSAVRCAPAYAALVNSAMIRHQDANDLYIPRPPQSVLSAGHCSDALGGVLALVDPTRNTGQDVLRAVVIAYETQVALASSFAWLERGLHSVSQINFAVPAAAAAFDQYELTPKTIVHAMALAATTGLCAQTWLKQGTKSAAKMDDTPANAAPVTNAPTDASSSSSSSSSAPIASQPIGASSDDGVPSIKFVSVGLAAHRALDSLQLARLGVTANADAMETLVRFFGRPDEDSPARRAAYEQLGREWTMDRHLIKQFAAQFNLQAAIACALELHAQGVRPENLASLHVEGHRFLCADVQGSAEAFAPPSQGSADHSTPYVIWAALQYGAFVPGVVYADAQWLREDVRAHLAKVTLAVVDEFERPRVTAGKLGCRLTAKLKGGSSEGASGTTIVAVRTATSGHPDAPLTDDELLGKMAMLIGDERARRVWSACQALVDSTDTQATKDLLDLLCTEA